MKNQFYVHFNLVQSKTVTEAEHESLKIYLRCHHVPNHMGNRPRGIGDIYDLEFVIKTHEELKDDWTNGEVLFSEGFGVVKKLFDAGIDFIEVK